MNVLFGPILLLAIAGAGQAPASPPSQPRVVLSRAVGDVEAALRALTPARPEGYLLLGEELADEASTPEEVALARRLFVLAIETGRDRGAAAVCATACRAIAGLAGSDSDRRWLEAIARRFDPAAPAPTPPARAESAVHPQIGLRAATALGLARSGRANLTARYLEDPDVLATLRRYDGVLRTEGLPGAEAWLLEQTETWPLGVGSLDRVERLPGDGAPVYRFDPVNHGNPGPELTDRQLVAHLRLESRLLSGIHRSWAAQLAAEQGEPLRDADPSRLAAHFGVDASATVYRDGVWIAPGSGDSESQSPEGPYARPDAGEDAGRSLDTNNDRAPRSPEP